MPLKRHNEANTITAQRDRVMKQVQNFKKMYDSGWNFELCGIDDSGDLFEICDALNDLSERASELDMDWDTLMLIKRMGEDASRLADKLEEQE